MPFSLLIPQTGIAFNYQKRKNLLDQKVDKKEKGNDETKILHFLLSVKLEKVEYHELKERNSRENVAKKKKKRKEKKSHFNIHITPPSLFKFDRWS